MAYNNKANATVQGGAARDTAGPSHTTAGGKNSYRIAPLNGSNRASEPMRDTIGPSRVTTTPNRNTPLKQGGAGQRPSAPDRDTFGGHVNKSSVYKASKNTQAMTGAAALMSGKTMLGPVATKMLGTIKRIGEDTTSPRYGKGKRK